MENVMANNFSNAMIRYLLRFNYIGTGYSGMQKQVLRGNEEMCGDVEVVSSIQGALEMSLMRTLHPAQNHNVVISSRTDKGVHAFSNAAHVDISHPYDNRASYLPQTIAYLMNKYLRQNNHQIRVIDAKVVPNTFHARYSAKSRSYVYRAAVLKKSCKLNHYGHIETLLPVVERNRCLPISSNFDKVLFARCATEFVGTHDFASFMKVTNDKNSIIKPTVRDLDVCEVRPGRGFGDKFLDPTYENWDFLEVHFKSRSFLYKQIRRIVGALVSVSQGRISEHELHQMLHFPGKPGTWNPRAVQAPPAGLYLTNVEYDPCDLGAAANSRGAVTSAATGPK